MLSFHFNWGIFASGAHGLASQWLNLFLVATPRPLNICERVALTFRTGRALVKEAED